MPLTWEEFYHVGEGLSINPRFLMPTAFDMRINFAHQVQDFETLRKIFNVINSVLVSVIKIKPGCDLNALTSNNNEKAITNPFSIDRDEYFFTFIYQGPVYGFALQVGPQAIIIRKSTCSVQDLVAWYPMLEDICQRLFISSGISRQEHALLDIMNIRDRMNRVSFAFEQQLRVTNHITEIHTKADNIEVMNKIMKIKFPNMNQQANADRDYPLAALNPDEIIRADASVIFSRPVNMKRKLITIQIEAPQNVIQRDIDLAYRCSSGGHDTIYHEDDLRDLKTPFIHFFRDIILNRFLPSLLYDINVEPRI